MAGVGVALLWACILAPARPAATLWPSWPFSLVPCPSPQPPYQLCRSSLHCRCPGSGSWSGLTSAADSGFCCFPWLSLACSAPYPKISWLCLPWLRVAYWFCCKDGCVTLPVWGAQQIRHRGVGVEPEWQMNRREGLGGGAVVSRFLSCLSPCLLSRQYVVCLSLYVLSFLSILFVLA